MWPNLTLTLTLTLTLNLSVSISITLTLISSPWSANRLLHLNMSENVLQFFFNFTIFFTFVQVSDQPNNWVSVAAVDSAPERHALERSAFSDARTQMIFARRIWDGVALCLLLSSSNAANQPKHTDSHRPLVMRRCQCFDFCRRIRFWIETGYNYLNLFVIRFP